MDRIRKKVKPLIASGFDVEVFRYGWSDQTKWTKKYSDFLEKVSTELDLGSQLSLVGNSASGHVVIRALSEFPQIHAVVNNCGMLRSPMPRGWRKILYLRRPINSEFVASVEGFNTIAVQKKIAIIADRVLTIRPIIDELVPRSTVSLKGASNVILPSVEHVLTIGLATSRFSQLIIDHIAGVENI